MTVFLIIGLLLNRRFGSRILFNTDIISSLCFIGSFSLFLPLPLQLYLSYIAIVFYSVLFLYSFIFRYITSHPFSHLLTLFLCILFRRRNPYPGYRNMSTNTSVLIISNDLAIIRMFLCQLADYRFIPALRECQCCFGTISHKFNCIFITSIHKNLLFVLFVCCLISLCSLFVRLHLKGHFSEFARSSITSEMYFSRSSFEVHSGIMYQTFKNSEISEYSPAYIVSLNSFRARIALQNLFARVIVSTNSEYQQLNLFCDGHRFIGTCLADCWENFIHNP